MEMERLKEKERLRKRKHKKNLKEQQEQRDSSRVNVKSRNIKLGRKRRREEAQRKSDKISGLKLKVKLFSNQVRRLNRKNKQLLDISSASSTPLSPSRVHPTSPSSSPSSCSTPTLSSFTPSSSSLTNTLTEAFLHNISPAATKRAKRKMKLTETDDETR